MSTRPKSTPHHIGTLLSVKLMPPHLPDGLILRSDLLARLDEGLKKKLVLLSAPTGYGKTTLARQWLDQCQAPFVWVTLDSNDNDPARFWMYALSAMRGLDLSLGKAALSALRSSPPPPMESILTSLLNDLGRLKQDSVLVLEDYHVIASAEIHAALSFLLQHLPETLHLILLTRSTPLSIPLGILRARDEMIELNAINLRFSRDQTAGFLQEILDAHLSSDTIDSLFQKSEGWPAGLRLLGSSLRDQHDSAEIDRLARSISGRDHYVGDYLMAEVLASQPESMQAFLLKTSFLSRLTGPLCDAVTEMTGGAARLDQLDRENLFLVQLESDANRLWYRYNPLFAESLQSLAHRRLGEESVRSIFEKASAWHEAQQHYEDAIEAALAARSFERALILIEKFIDLHDVSGLGTLDRWLKGIPTEQALQHPSICFVHAQVILYMGDRFEPAIAARIEPLINAAEHAWREQEQHQAIGEVLSFRANVALWQGNFGQAFDYAHQSLAELPESDVLYRGNSLLILSHEALNAGRITDAQDLALEARALLGAAQNIYGVLASLQVLAEAFFWQGELQPAEQLNRQILEEAIGGVSMLDDQGAASLGLARIAHEQNDLAGAESFVVRALGLSMQRGNELLNVKASICLAWVHAAHNDLAQAQQVLKSCASRIRNPGYLREIQEMQARLSILAGELLTLQSWEAVVSSASQDVLPEQQEREAFTLARLRIAQGEPTRVPELLAIWQQDAAKSGRIRSQVQALCLDALAKDTLSDSAEAIRALSEALALGHAKSFRRLFLDEGPRMAALLSRALPSLPNQALRLYATTLLHSFDPQSLGQGFTTWVEPLTPQESRVLRLLVAGRSNADIAQELVLSANTVKSHVKSIYRKLHISSREEARQVARELKLL